MTGLDHRVQCVACAHYRADRCHNAIAAGWPAGKAVREVGPALAVLKQDCQGYKQKEKSTK